MIYQDEQRLYGSEAWNERTLIDLLTLRRMTKKNDIVFRFLGDGETVTETLTPHELHVQASQVAAHLFKTLRQGARVVLLFETSLDYVVGLYGCIYAGVIPVSGVHPTALGSAERFAYIINDCAAEAVLGQREVLQNFHQAQRPDTPKTLKWVPFESAVRATKMHRPDSGNPGDLALIQYTSGSTENPKGVCLSHRNIVHNIHAQVLSFQLDAHDIGLSWLPFTHDMGLIGAILPALAAGNPFYFMSPNSFIEKPTRWMAAMSRYGVTVSGGPDFAYRHCARLPESLLSPQWDLSGWRLAFNASENISQDTLTAFSEKFGPYGFSQNAFFACYGLAENALLVTAAQRGQGINFTAFSRDSLAKGTAEMARGPNASESVTRLANCGTAAGHQSVFIVEAESRTFLDERQIGEIWITGPSVCLGYENNPLRNAESFTEINGTRFLQTQDYGFLCDGKLYLVGRLTEQFSYNGETYYTSDIALSMSHALGGGLAVVAPPSENGIYPISVMIEHNDINVDDVLVTRMRDTLKTYRLSRFAYYFIRKGFVVRTPSGKVCAVPTLQNILSNKTAIIASGSTEHAHFSGRTRMV